MDKKDNMPDLMIELTERIKELENQVEIFDKLNYAQNACLLELRKNFEKLERNFKLLNDKFDAIV